MAPGSYIGIVTLKKPLDFEARSSYDMVIRATDTPADPATALSTTAVPKLRPPQSLDPSLRWSLSPNVVNGRVSSP